ncbi:VOC family protein [Pseudonocardia nigra]|uniref:VOC family protein n=1 Tax=Pseudonocardia nigra TaxID=1921578 RepID=UPI001C5FD994|nr:VOC family protein [Pseudonocardia nigra]
MTEILDLYPRLVVDGADAALAFYTAALGGEVVERYTDPDGRVVHAMVAAGGVRFAVKDADGYDRAPGEGGVPVIVALFTSDPDAVAERMVQGGATVVFPVADHPYGERGGRLADPFGHLWMVARRTEQLAPEEIQARTTAMYG